MADSRKTVEVRVRLPIPSRGTMVHALKQQSKKVALGVVILFALVGAGLFFITKNQSPQPTAASTKLQGGRAEKVSYAPEYKTILPANRTIEQLGGWTRVSPPDKNPVFAYSDTLAGSPINVSQQPLPEDFKSDTDEQIEIQAQWLHASEKLAMGPTTVYIANSQKGPQSLIFTKSDLLVMIRSSVKLSNDQWIGYVNSLQ